MTINLLSTATRLAIRFAVPGALLLGASLLGGPGSSALAQDSTPPATATSPAAAAGTDNASAGDGGPAGRERGVPDGPLVVATKEAPPFAMRDADGEWSGISIALWESVAGELGLDYRLEEASLVDLVAGVADGRFDASVAATTITPSREREVDFSHPFHTTGFAIAVRRGESGWWGMLESLLSPAFFKAIGLLALVLTAVGTCFWLAERRRNAAEFRPGLTGLGDGFWFSAVTMTTTGYGDMAPRTLAGRLVGLVWMFTALIITSTFTGMIASALTAERLALVVEGPGDLPNVATGSVAGSASDDWLSGHGIAFAGFPDASAGLDALAREEIDAFVHDRPLLRHLINDPDRDALRLAPGDFGRQDYGIALPSGSAMREPLNRALLRHLDGDAWTGTLTRHLGQSE